MNLEQALIIAVVLFLIVAIFKISAFLWRVIGFLLILAILWYRREFLFIGVQEFLRFFKMANLPDQLGDWWRQFISQIEQWFKFG